MHSATERTGYNHIQWDSVIGTNYIAVDLWNIIGKRRKIPAGFY